MKTFRATIHPEGEIRGQEEHLICSLTEKFESKGEFLVSLQRFLSKSIEPCELRGSTNGYEYDFVSKPGCKQCDFYAIVSVLCEN